MDDLHEGHHIYKDVSCKGCGCIPKRDPVECKHCETIFCQQCAQDPEKDDGEQQTKKRCGKCPVCKETLIVKGLNRKVKEIMFSQLRYKCQCQNKQIASDPYDQIGGELSETTMATESLLNDVLKVDLTK